MKGTKFHATAVLLVLLFLSLFNGDMKKVSAEGGRATLEMSSAEGYTGDTVTVTVSLTENPGIAGMGVWVCYDKSFLKVIDVNLSEDVFVEDLAECQKAGDGYVGYAAAGSRDNTKTGQLFTIQFEIIEGAVTGDSVLTYSGSNGAPEASNAEGNTVELNLVAGKVTVSCRHENTTSAETPATCTEAGSKTTTCIDCGQVVKTETSAALGHDWGVYKVTKEATCTGTGAETAKCSRCDAEDTREIAALGHDWGVYKVTKEATCTETGTETAKCGRCDAADTREIPALGHDWGEYTVTKKPTCTETGVETVKCSRCDATDATDTREIAALGHDWGAYKVTREAACTETGAETAKCSRCDATDTREIAALGHDWGEYTVVEEATCTETGIEAAKCSRCDATDATDTREIPALGHDWGEYVVTEAATCTETGAETAECSRCDTTDTREIPALEHVYGNLTVTKEESETENGEIKVICTVDGAEVTWTIPAIQKNDFLASIITEDGTEFEKAEFMEGAIVSFTASVQGVNKEVPETGEVRYIPVGWNFNQESGEMAVSADGLYSATVLMGNSGNCTLEILYNRQMFDGTEWVTYGTYTCTLTAHVAEKTENKSESQEEENSNEVPASGSNAEIVSPKTGERGENTMAVAAMLFGVSCILGACIIKKKRVK